MTIVKNLQDNFNISKYNEDSYFLTLDTNLANHYLAEFSSVEECEKHAPIIIEKILSKEIRLREARAKADSNTKWWKEIV